MGLDFGDFSVSGISLVKNNFHQKRKNRKCLEIKLCFKALFAKKKHSASQVVMN